MTDNMIVKQINQMARESMRDLYPREELMIRIAIKKARAEERERIFRLLKRKVKRTPQNKFHIWETDFLKVFEEQKEI